MNPASVAFVLPHSAFTLHAYVCRPGPGTRPAPHGRRASGDLHLGPDGRRLRPDRRPRRAGRRLDAAPARRPRQGPRGPAPLPDRLHRPVLHRLRPHAAHPPLPAVLVLVRQHDLRFAQRRPRRSLLEIRHRGGARLALPQSRTTDHARRPLLGRLAPLRRRPAGASRGPDAVRAQRGGPALAAHLRPGRPQFQGGRPQPRPVGLFGPPPRLPVRRLVHRRTGQDRGPAPHLRLARLLGHDADAAAHQRAARRLQHPRRYP